MKQRGEYNRFDIAQSNRQCGFVNLDFQALKFVRYLSSFHLVFFFFLFSQ